MFADKSQKAYLSVRAFLEESTMLVGKSLGDFLPEDHPSLFVKLCHNTVTNSLSLEEVPLSTGDGSAMSNPVEGIKVASSVNQVCQRKMNEI